MVRPADLFKKFVGIELRIKSPVGVYTVLSTLLGKLTVAGVALPASTSGLTVTGNVSDTAQAGALEAVSNIGIEIPGPADVELPDQTDGVEVSEVGAPLLPGCLRRFKTRIQRGNDGWLIGTSPPVSLSFSSGGRFPNNLPNLRPLPGAYGRL